MRILAAFKMVANLEDLTEGDWKIGPNLRPEEAYARPIVNPDDESALELALRLREALGTDKVYLSAITLGDSPGARRVGQTLKALGFDRVTIAVAPKDSRFCPDLIAGRLAPLAEGFDLIVTGCRSADGQNGLTAMYLAERLGFPLIVETLNFYPAGPGQIAVESLSDDGILSQILTPPIVLAIGNAPSAFLRVPTIKARLDAAKSPLDIIAPPADPSANHPETTEAYRQPTGTESFASLTTLERLERKRQGQLITEGSPAEKAARLLDALNGWKR
ncbi:MAG: hypothetical protein LBJ61_02260 [Deltaproteobacteria bacterium]|jgi:electron transfer flavoprotein alpha/beta subunit|nr:hypothetical protein [Deltaproteobacteria bacterium]